MRQNGREKNNLKTKDRGSLLVPDDLINQTCLEQRVSVWQQAVADVVLIGPHRHAVAHTQRA